MEEEVKEYYLHPGYIFFSEEKYIIKTILGSCVALCIWDKRKKIGGMNHYIYSYDTEKKRNCKYGENSIRKLLNFFKESGSKAIDLEAYIVGGAENPKLSSKIGDNNVKLAIEMMEKYKIEVVDMKTGGNKGRKVLFENYNGVCKVRKIGE